MAFDFSGEGSKFAKVVGAGGNGNKPARTEVVVVEGAEKTINHKGVQYWFDYSQEMVNKVNSLIDQKDEMFKIAIERRANDAGLRAVIRALLAELRKKDPNNPLLDKKNRDRLFNEFHKEEMGKVLKATGREPWNPLKRPEEKQTP